MQFKIRFSLTFLAVVALWTFHNATHANIGETSAASDDIPPVIVSREAEVLLRLLDIPIDLDKKTDRCEVDSEAVTRAVQELVRFTNEELEAGIVAYLNWWGSDDFDDRIAKLYTVNAYLFDVPEWTDENKGALKGVYFQEFPIPVKDGKIALQYPWMPDGSGDLKLGIRRFTTQRTLSLPYDGLAAFRALKSQFPRRHPEKIEIEKSGTSITVPNPANARKY